MQQNNEIIIHSNELQILLNLIAKDTIVIDYPLYDLKMVKARPSGNGYHINVQSDVEVMKELYEYSTHTDELPSFDDIKYCMLLSGIIQYDNIVEFQEKLRALNKLDRTIYFAPDTNLFYQAAFSKLNIPNPHYLVVDTVYDEIESSINHKYFPYFIYEMKEDALYHGELLDELKNRKPKKSRKAAYIAMREYKRIPDNVIETKAGEPSTIHSERNDIIIVRAIRNFQDSNQYVFPLILTADTNMAELCMGKGPECFHLTYPSSLDVNRCTPYQLRDLIFYLAKVCGLIKCNSVIIYGEYSHKTWNDNSLKLVFQDATLYDRFKEDHSLCQELMALEIEK